MKKILQLKLNYILFLFAFSIFTACEKSEDINLELQEQNHGVLSAKFIDANGSPLSNVNVALYQSIVYNHQSRIQDVYELQKTDKNGIVNFGQLISDRYYIAARNIEIDGKTYNVLQPVQVLTDEHKEIEIKPQTHLGTLRMDVLTRRNEVPLANVSVALYPEKKYTEGLTHDEILAGAHATGTTSPDGKIELSDIPASTHYIAYVYYDKEHAGFAYSDDFLRVTTGKKQTVSIHVNERDVFDIKGHFQLHTYYYGYDSNGNYGHHNVANLNVAFIKEDDFYTENLASADLNKIRKYIEYSGKTNSFGELYIEVDAETEYRILFFTDANKYDWHYYSYSVYEFETEHHNISIDEDALGLSN